MVALYVGGQKVEWADAEKVLAEAERIELRNAAGKVLGVVPQPLIRDDDPDWVKAITPEAIMEARKGPFLTLEEYRKQTEQQ